MMKTKTVFVYALVVILILGCMAVFFHNSLRQTTTSTLQAADPAESNVPDSDYLSEDLSSGTLSAEGFLSGDVSANDSSSDSAVNSVPASGNDSETDVFDEIVVEYNEDQGFTIG